VKEIGGMAAHLNKADDNNRVHNEMFAYELFHCFGFESEQVSFPTTVEVINEIDKDARIASLCAFVNGVAPLKSYVGTRGKALDINSPKTPYTKEAVSIFERSRIHDFLTGNLDGHEGNAFVIVKDGRLVGMVNFDYDKAFPVDAPTTIGNTYKWAELAIAKENFTKETIEFLTDMLENADSKIGLFLKFARKDGDNNFSQRQEDLFRARIELLRGVVEGKINTLAELGSYKDPRKYKPANS
jgi:hypothetical protein